MKRPVRIEGEIGYITLTMGYEAMIDAADIPLVAGYNWQAHPHRSTIYAKTAIWRDGRNVGIYLHRMIAAVPKGVVVDHIDRNGLNNRRANMRQATCSENLGNRPANKNNPTGLKGTYFDKRRGVWNAYISKSGKRQFLGKFDCPLAAADAYDAAAKLVFGGFALTNEQIRSRKSSTQEATP